MKTQKKEFVCLQDAEINIGPGLYIKADCT